MNRHTDKDIEKSKLHELFSSQPQVSFGQRSRDGQIINVGAS